MLKWWENAAEFKGLQSLAHHATNALTFPVTSTVAEGSFRILKGLLTPDRRYMSPSTQIGYLLCMINGDVTRRIRGLTSRGEGPRGRGPCNEVVNFC